MFYTLLFLILNISPCVWCAFFLCVVLSFFSLSLVFIVLPSVSLGMASSCLPCLGFAELIGLVGWHLSISSGPVSSQPLSLEYYFFSICFLLPLQDNTVSYINLFGISQHSGDLSLSLILLSFCVSIYMTSIDLFLR